MSDKWEATTRGPSPEWILCEGCGRSCDPVGDDDAPARYCTDCVARLKESKTLLILNARLIARNVERDGTPFPTDREIVAGTLWRLADALESAMRANA